MSATRRDHEWADYVEHTHPIKVIHLAILRIETYLADEPKDREDDYLDCTLDLLAEFGDTL